MDPTEVVSIGRIGVRVSRLGLGMASFGYAARATDEDAVAVVGALRALGLRHVDVAPEYGLGLAELRLGRALAAGAGEGAIVSTEGGPADPAGHAALPHGARAGRGDVEPGGRGGSRREDDLRRQAAPRWGLTIAARGSAGRWSRVGSGRSTGRPRRGSGGGL